MYQVAPNLLQDYDKFAEALEDEKIDEFFGLAPKVEVSQATVEVTGVRHTKIVFIIYVYYYMCPVSSQG